MWLSAFSRDFPSFLFLYAHPWPQHLCGTHPALIIWDDPDASEIYYFKIKYGLPMNCQRMVLRIKRWKTMVPKCVNCRTRKLLKSLRKIISSLKSLDDPKFILLWKYDQDVDSLLAKMWHSRELHENSLMWYLPDIKATHTPHKRNFHSLQHCRCDCV